MWQPLTETRSPRVPWGPGHAPSLPVTPLGTFVSALLTRPQFLLVTAGLAIHRGRFLGSKRCFSWGLPRFC